MIMLMLKKTHNKIIGKILRFIEGEEIKFETFEDINKLHSFVSKLKK